MPYQLIIVAVVASAAALVVNYFINHSRQEISSNQARPGSGSSASTASTSPRAGKRVTFSSAVAHLRALSSLKNVYFAVRHGESEANVLALVSSDNELARKQHGLTQTGKKDATGAGMRLRELLASGEAAKGNETIVVHSPFLRTKQTADIVAKVIEADALVSEDLLRERWFGVFEGKHSHDSYNKVWAQDAINGCETNIFECESVYDVSERAAEVILKCERMVPEGGCRFIIVSHGDILQILRATLNRGMDQKTHRLGEHLNPGQVITLSLS